MWLTGKGGARWKERSNANTSEIRPPSVDGSLCCGLAYIYITGLQICSLVWTKLNVSVLRCQCIKTKYIVRLFIEGDLYKCQYSKLCDDFYRVHGSGRMWVTWQLAINGAITTCSRPLIIVSCSCPVHCTNALEISTRELCWGQSSLPYSIVGLETVKPAVPEKSVYNCGCPTSP